MTDGRTHRQNHPKVVLKGFGVLAEPSVRTSIPYGREVLREHLMGMKARETPPSINSSVSSPWSMIVPRERIDWPTVRDQIDLAAVATALLGPTPGRRGERGRRLWWRCPFHQDANPSFAIEPGKPWWRCWGCSEHGDAAALVMKVRGIAFPEAIRWLAEQAGIAPASMGSAPRRPPPSMAPRPPAASPVKAPEQPPDRSTGLPWPMPWLWPKPPSNASGRPRDRPLWLTSKAGD